MGLRVVERPVEWHANKKEHFWKGARLTLYTIGKEHMSMVKSIPR